MPLPIDFSRMFGHLVLVGGLAFTTTLVAEEPTRPAGEQPAINQAEPAAKKDQVETPFYGIGLENTDRSVPRVTFVKKRSNIDEAGIEVGDLILEFGEVHDVPFEKFLEGVEEVIRNTDNTDSIHVAYERDGRVNETEMKGFGRSVESRRRLKERSEKRIEKALAPDPQDQQAWSSEQTVSTEMIEEYLALRERQAGNELSVAERSRYDRLGGVVLGGYAGYGYRGYTNNAVGNPAALAGRVQAARQGVATTPGGNVAQADATAAGNQAAVPPGANVGGIADSALRQEIQTLRASQQQGELTEAQGRRLFALNRLNQLVDQTPRTGTGSAAGGSNPQGFQPLSTAQQTQMRQLERRSRFGALDTQQRQQLQQFRQQRRNAAAGQPGANNNMPRGAQGAAQQGQQNASPVQQGVGASVGESAAGNGQVPSTNIGK